MNYREFQPSPFLQQLVECFWTLSTSRESEAPSRDKVLPDGCTEIIFNLADAFKRYHADGGTELQPRTLIVGQMRRPALIQPTGRVKLFGIRFRPTGAYPFLRFPQHELNDMIIDLKTVWSRLGTELEERIQLAASARERVRVAETFLHQRLVSTFANGQAVEKLAQRILLTNGRQSVEQLSRDIGLTSRQLERKFQIMVGIGPKLLARIIRFQKIFKALEHCAEGWSAVAYDCGYYDQAHLIHDFRTFSGENPTAFFKQDRELSEYFMRKNRMSDFYKI